MPKVNRTGGSKKSGSIIMSFDPARLAEEIAARLLDLVGDRLNEHRDDPSPLLFTVGAITKRTGLGETFIKNEIRAGRLRASRAGDRPVVTPEAFAAWVKSLRPIGDSEVDAGSLKSEVVSQLTG